MSGLGRALFSSSCFGVVVISGSGAIIIRALNGDGLKPEGIVLTTIHILPHGVVVSVGVIVWVWVSLWV